MMMMPLGSLLNGRTVLLLSVLSVLISFNNAVHLVRPAIVLQPLSNDSGILDSVLSLLQPEESSGDSEHGGTATTTTSVEAITDADNMNVTMPSSAETLSNYVRVSKDIKSRKKCSKSRKNKDRPCADEQARSRDLLYHLLRVVPEDSVLNLHIHLDDKDAGAADEDDDRNMARADEKENTTYEMTPEVKKRKKHRKDKARTKRQVSIFPTPDNWNFMRWRQSRPPPQPPMQPPQVSMKRVIFTRCPYYPCPNGFLCDFRSHSCRSMFFPDYDM